MCAEEGARFVDRFRYWGIATYRTIERRNRDRQVSWRRGLTASERGGEWGRTDYALDWGKGSHGWVGLPFGLGQDSEKRMSN